MRHMLHVWESNYILSKILIDNQLKNMFTLFQRSQFELGKRV